MKCDVEDRRGAPRFEIVGELWGTLDMVVRTPLLDIGRGGVLVRSPVPLTPPSVHHILVDADGLQSSTSVEVCHAHEVTDSQGRTSFLVGLDFLSMPPILSAHVDAWIERGRHQVRAGRPGTATVERRRMPRTRIAGAECIRLQLQHRVRLLDISRSGALLACEASLPPGTRACLRTALGGFPFDADVGVTRQHKSACAPYVCLGALFASIEDRNVQHLEQFLNRGGQQEPQGSTGVVEKHER